MRHPRSGTCAGKGGRVKEAREVAAMLPTKIKGYSMQDLMDVAAGFGYEFKGLHVSDNDMEKLPLPAIVQLNARNGGDSGHYWVLERVKGEEVELFDPQAGHRYNQTIAEFAREWDGVILAFQASDTSSGIGIKLSQAEMEERYGGCCGVPRPPEKLGDPCEGDPCCKNKGPSTSCSTCSSAGKGAPAWSVNMVNINLFMTDTPLWYEPSIGPPVKITLNYNSQSSIAYNQPFGNKWQFNYASYLVVDTGGTVTIFMPDGRNDVYSPDGSGGYTKPFGVFNTLTKLAENHFTLRFPDDSIFEYAIPSGTTSLQPFLVKISDQYGQSLTFGYDTNVHLTTITDALGQVTTITYTNGFATSVADPFGRIASFEYDGGGNLTKMTDMGGYWSSLTYDSNVYLTSLGNSRGTWQFYIEPADGINNGSNHYPAPGGTMWQNYRITVTNPLGGKEQYQYDGYSGYSWYVSPRYYIPYVNSNTNNYASAIPKKKYYFSTVGGKGKVSNIINEDGGSETYIYDSITGKRTGITDSNYHTTSYTYNAMGRTTSVTDAKSKTTTMTYAPNNVDLTGITNGLGTVTNGYDGFHNMTSVTNLLGKTTSYAYNGYGQKTSETDALSIVTGFNYYDTSSPSKYRLQTITRDGKTTFGFTYDSKGRILTRTDLTGLTLMYTYNNLDQVTGIAYPDGKQETYAYSPCCPRLLDSYTDRTGRTTSYTYDEMRHLIQVKQPDGTLIKYDYDANGNLVKLTDPNSGITTFSYDAVNRLAKKTYADGKYETYSYDGLGLLKNKANARDTAANRITATYSYDPNNNLTGITYTDGTPNVNYAYDDYDRVTSRIDGIGTWGYGYDADSHLTSVDGPWDNDTLSYVYDDIGRRTSVSPQGGETIAYVYDNLSRLTQINPGSRTFSYAYPANSPSPLPVNLIRPNGSFTTYQFDNLNRLLEIDNKNSAQQLINADAFTYNAQDVRGSETITNGTPITNFTAGLTTYNYNAVNQLLATAAPNRLFNYDADGNMTTGYTPDGYQYTATYDAENRLKSIDYTDGESVAHHTDYYYSGDGLLARQVVDGMETRFVRDGFTLLQERDSSNNVTRSYSFDPTAPGGIGGLLELSQGGQQYSYLFDGKGNVSSLLDSTQAIVTTYTYDEFGNLMVKGGTIDQPFRFSTKPYDEKTGLSYYGYRFYAPVLGRWINRDPLKEVGGINIYGFVQNNAVNFTDPLGFAMDQGGKGPLTSQDPEVQKAVEIARESVKEAREYLDDVINKLEKELKNLTKLCERKELIKRLNHLRAAAKVLPRYFTTPIIVIDPSLFNDPFNINSDKVI